LRVAIYTVLTLGYDNIEKSILKSNEIFDSFLITDKELTDYLPNINSLVVDNRFSEQFLFNRYYKFNPFGLIKGYDLVIYYDSNLLLNLNEIKSFINYVNLLIFDILIFKHPESLTISNEIIYARTISKISNLIFLKLINTFSSTNLFSNEVSENNIIVYKNMSEKPLYFEEFFQLIILYKRDQFFFLWLLKKYNINYFLAPANLKSSLFTSSNHIGDESLNSILSKIHKYYFIIKYFFYKAVFHFILKFNKKIYH